MIYPGTELFNFSGSLFYPALLYMDNGDTACTGSDLFEKIIDGFGTFFRTHVSLNMPALTQLARYYYNPIGSGLKCFDQVRNVNFSGTGQADYLEIMIL
jgi:hypothetical protein